MKNAPPLNKVPANPDNWSDASKNCGAYHYAPSAYADYTYKCQSCSQPAVFSAEEQRRTYEERKAYIWQRRTLCPSCFRDRLAVEAELSLIQGLWAAERELCKNDTKFLTRWLELLEQHVRLGARRDVANTKMLAKLLGRDEA
jgi:hypothetical protein